MCKRVFLVSILCFQVGLYANTLYVQSPVAKLSQEPIANSPGVNIPQGAVVRKIGEQGFFARVVYEGKEGWVNQLFLSANPPSQKVNFGSSIEKSTAITARARASAFTQTAAARGFTETKAFRTRATTEYDFESISWLEKLNQSSEHKVQGNSIPEQQRIASQD